MNNDIFDTKLFDRILLLDRILRSAQISTISYLVGDLPGRPTAKDTRELLMSRPADEPISILDELSRDVDATPLPDPDEFVRGMTRPLWDSIEGCERILWLLAERLEDFGDRRRSRKLVKRLDPASRRKCRVRFFRELYLTTLRRESPLSAEAMAGSTMPEEWDYQYAKASAVDRRAVESTADEDLVRQTLDLFPRVKRLYATHLLQKKLSFLQALTTSTLLSRESFLRQVSPGAVS